MIHLAVGRLEVDWGKNNFFTDHGALFQPTDIKLVPSYYVGDDWPEGEPIVEMNEGFGKPLGHVLVRLELLGYTLRAVEHHYNRLHQFHDLDEDALPFNDLRQALARVDVNKVSGNYCEDYDPGEFVRKEILERLALRLRGMTTINLVCDRTIGKWIFFWKISARTVRFYPRRIPQTLTYM